MKKSFRRYLAFLMAFAMLASYSFSPQNLTAFAVSGVDSQLAAADEQQTDETKATDPPQDETKPEQTEPSDEGNTEPTVPEEVTPEEETAPPEDEEVLYPETSFVETAGGVTVSIDAPEGALPEGATVKVVAVSAGEISDAVEELIDNSKVVKAVDITFYNKDGDKIEPKKEVSVSFASKKFGDLNNPSVVHITDNGDAERVSGADVSTKNKEATFESDEFSIYAVVDEGDDARLLVKFMNGETEIASMYVKKGDNMEQVIHDPGTGDVASGVTFKGWTTNAGYTSEDISSAKTISQVREAATAQVNEGVTDGDTVTYYAMLFKQYQINYLDDTGASLGVKNVTGRADDSAEYQSYTIDMNYTPKDDEHNFAGWNVKTGGNNIEGFTEGALYEFGQTINVKGDVTFSVNTPAGHWLVFNENGKGATYNAPQFVEAGKNTQEPSLAMTRNGYTFGGWYDTKEHADAHAEDPDVTTGEFSFGRTISDRTEIFASWIPQRTANYSVIIWKQNLAGNGYDFEETIPLSGNVNTTINTVTQQGTGDNAYARINGQNKQYEGFHLKKDGIDQNVTIAPEGNSVVNVYYDRTEYTLTFNALSYQRVNSPSNYDQNLYGYVNDWGYVKLTRSGGRWVFEYNNRWYRYSDDGNGNYYHQTNETVKTITALYGQDISSNFPIPGYPGYVWEPQDSDVFTDGDVPSLETMPAENTTFVAKQYGTGTMIHMYYYTETVDGNGPINYNGKNFEEHQHVTISADGNVNSTKEEDFVPILGFDRFGSDPAYGADNRVELNNGNNYTIKFYYERKHYSINYMDGVYVDGNNNPIEGEANRGQLHTETGISYGADISSYNKGGDNYYEPTYGEYVFEGWYLDENCTQGHECNFDTMPEGGVNVYAKWRLTQYRVFLHPNAGTDPTLDWGSENQDMNFRVSSGGKISTPTGQRTGYEFVGWYTDPQYQHVFNADTVLNNSTVTTEYDKTTHMTDPMDKWGNGATTNADVKRFWITKEFNLYAKWRKTLDGADGIGIIYDANGGSNPPTDRTLYLDSSEATAGAAPTAPEGKEFKYWVIQRYNEETGQYEDTAGPKTVDPGASFSVLQEDARVEEIIDPEHPDITKRYTVQLRAQYSDPEEATPTQISWYKNDGSPAFHKDTTGEGGNPLKINEAVDIQSAQTREGFNFIGWARVDIGNSAADIEAFENNPANFTQNLSAPYLYYNKEGNGSFHLTSTTGKTVTQVAADEETPYQAMFAVWQPKLQVMITGNTGTREYNGAEQNVTGYTVKYKVGDGEWTTTAPEGVSVAIDGQAKASGTDVGTYNMNLTKDMFTVTPGQYAFDAEEDLTVVDGWLKITKKQVNITITGNTDTKTYTGSEQSVTGYEVTIPAGVSITEDDITFTGTAEAKGTDVTIDDNKYPMGLAESQFSVSSEEVAANYDVTFTVTDGWLKITPLDVTVTITGNTDSKPYNGENQSVTGYTAEASSNLYDVEGDDKDFSFSGSDTATRKDVGTTNMGLTADKFTNNNDNFNVTFVIGQDGSMTITPLEVTVKIKGNTDTEVYNGAEQNVTGYEVTEISNPLYTVGDFTFSGNQTAKGTDVGTYPMNLSDTQFTNTNANFDVTFDVTDGSLEITPLEVTVDIAGHIDTKAYDGNPHTVTGYDVTNISSNLYTAADFTFSGEATATRTPKGETPMNLTAGQFTNNNDNFDVTFNVTDGKMIITSAEKVVVTITGNKMEADYNGQPHTATGYTVSISNPLYTEADFAFNGTASATQTNVGTKDMGLKPAMFTNTNENFEDVEFVVVDGSMTINPIDVTVTITGNNDETDYNGASHKVTGYNIKADNDLYNYSTSVTFTPDANVELDENDKPIAKRTDAGTTPMNLAVSQFANTDDNFNVTFVVNDGYQTINKINAVVTIVGANNTADYDGKTHTITGYTATSSNDLYKVTGDNVDFTFSGTAAASREDVGTTNMGLAANQFVNTNPNFETVTFQVTDGYQTIEPIDVTVTIVGDHSSVDYDGNEHGVSGYEVTISNPLYTAADFTFNGTAEATRTDAGKTDMGLSESQFTNTNTNFGTVTFNVTDGYQEIKPINVTVNIKGTQKSENYDGTEHTATGYEVTSISNSLYTEADFTFSGTATASRTDVGKTDMGLTASQFTNTNTNFGTVTFNVTDGYQEIKPIDVTVTIVGKNSSVDYDGNEHSVSGYEVTISNPLYTEADFTFSGTAEAARTDAGKTPMGLDASQFTNTNTNFGTVTFNVTDGYQEIKKIDVTVTIVGNNHTDPYDGKDHTVTGYTATSSNDLYKVTGDNVDFTFSGTASATQKNVGTKEMGLNEDQFTNTNPNFETVTFDITDGYQTITPIDVTVTIVGNNHTDPYDGEEHTVTGYDVTNISSDLYTEADFTFTGEAKASRTTQGTTYMNLSESQFENKNGNFANVTFEITDGYQTITKKGAIVVTITGHQSSVPYDGTEHSVSGYDVEINDSLYTEADFEFTGGTATASQKDAGKDEMGLTSGMFRNTNENFENVVFVVTDGYQEITPISVTVDIKGTQSSVDYDGESHTATGYEVTNISSDLYTEADFSFSGEATATRTDVGKTNMNLTADQFTNNNKNFTNVVFNITDGYQEIKPISVTVTITGKQVSVDYDGEEHTADGYYIHIDNPLYTEADFTFSGTKTVTRTDAGKTNMNLAPEQFTNTNTNFENVTFVVAKDGYVEVKPIDVTVTITGHNSTLPYDGAEHTVTGYDVTNISSDLYTEADFSFSGTATATRQDVGTANMNLTADQFKNNNANFKTVTFNVTDGYQTITPIDITVTIVGNNSTLPYDGTEHSVSGYTAKANNALYDVTKDFTFSGTDSAARTNAGQSDMGLVASQFTNTNENFSDVNFVITDGYQKITPIEVTVTITGHNNTTVYDGQSHTVTGYDASADNALYDVTKDFAFNGTDSATRTDAGQTDMGLTPQQFSNTNGNFTNVTFNVTDGYQEITKATMSVTAIDYDGTYDGKPHSGGATLSVPDGTTVQYSTDGGQTWSDQIPSITDVGEVDYIVKATNPNYEDATDEGTLKVDRKTVTVQAENQAKKYGEDDPELTTVVEGLVGNDTIDFDVSREPGENVGTYTITPAGDETQGNYTIEYKTGTLTISKADAFAVTAIDGSKTYDGTPLNGGITGDVPEGTTISYSTDGGETWSQTPPSITDAGSVTYLVKAENDNYETATDEGTLTIDRAVVTVKADNKDKTYGDSDPTWTAEVTGMVNGESADDLLDFSFEREPGENVGDYEITVSGDETQGNYTVKYEPGTLTINPANMDVDVEGYKGVYDAQSHEPTVTPEVTDGTKIEYSTDGGQTWSEDVPSRTDVGTTEVTVRVTNDNYNPVEKTVTLEVTRAEVVVKAYDNNKVYGDDDPELTAEVTGVIDDFEIQYTVERDPGENVGNYDINPSGEEEQGNYKVTYEKGNFEITKAGTLVITTNDYNGVYDGNDHAANVSVNVKDGTTIEYSTDGGKTWTTEPPTVKNVSDSTTVLVRATNDNYETVTAELTMTVTPKAVTIRTGSASKTYDGKALKKKTATITGLVDGDEAEVTATGSRTKVGSSKNTYDIEWTNADPSNYTITERLGTLRVKPAPTPTPPAPGPGPGPGPGPAPGPTPTVIADNTVPQTVIDDNATPKAPVQSYWALINLICAIITALLSLIMLIRYFGKRREEDEETGETTEIKRKGGVRLASIIPAIGAIIAFILTEDMSDPWTWVDKWTILMVIILAIQVIVAIIAKKKTDDDQEGPEPETAA